MPPERLHPKPLIRSLMLVLLLNTLAAVAEASETLPVATKGRDGVRLSGLLHLPSQATAVVILIHGSEPGRKEGYREMVAALNESGIAALTWDKRGVGDSGGEYVEAPDLAVPAADVVSWVEFLERDERARDLPKGLLGWSQGGWIGPLAAAQHTSVRFVVMISGPAVSPLEQNIYDKSNQFRASSTRPERAALFEETIRAAWTYLVTGEGREEAAHLWALVEREPWFEEAYQGPPFGDRETLLQHPRMLNYVAHNGYDPSPVLASLKIPVLAIFGGADRIVPVDSSAARLEETLGDLVTIHVVPDADHHLRVTSPAGVRRASGVHSLITRWISDVVNPAISATPVAGQE